MEAVPRLPMISFDLKTSTEIVSFSTKLKQYISTFYHEDSESYNAEIHNLETLRAAAVRPTIDVSGCQLLKKYYCQLHFLKSRFPMEDGQVCAVYFSWRDNYSNMVCSVADIDFELMNILFDIGAIHSKLGAEDSRVNPEGMKLACTHFQCAAWAFQTVRKEFPQMVSLVLAPEVIQFMHLICFAQAQECILEKSMMDNRKATIIAKVVVQVVDYYKQALTTLQTAEDGSLSELLGSRTYKDWIKYINFKIVYHKAIALLYQGEQSEEQQKMGERVAFYQAASDTLQEAYKKASNLLNQQEINEALAFTNDVIEGKKKAAKNENEFIYHEEVPDKDALQEIKGASLVKGIAFSVNDVDVSGPDIFAKLVPMEAHEASSLYSEQKANMLRQLGEVVENKDKTLAEFMSSLQLDGLSQMHQASGLTQDLVDRAAAMNARPTAIKDLVDSMAQLSNIFHDVESMLSDIEGLLKEEETKEKEYQSQMGVRPPSIIATDLTREYTKYQEAHSKACESNQNLHKAMTTHSANLKILSLPLAQIKLQIPSIEFPNSNIDQDVINEMESLLAKVDEMKKQRAMLWAQYHDAVKNDDITARLVTCSPQFTKEQLFEEELQKHRNQAALIEQNMVAQDNILKALVEAYAKFTNTRRYIQDILMKRATMLSSLNNSYDTYDDLLAKANKGLEFYTKLETNVSKLLQRIKSTCKVQDEERDQILAKQNKPTIQSTAPKLKDYLEAKQLETSDLKSVDKIQPSPALDSTFPVIVSSALTWPPGVRPAPLGSEMTTEKIPSYGNEHNFYPHYCQPPNLNPTYPSYVTAATTVPNTTTTFSSNSISTSGFNENKNIEELNALMNVLMPQKLPHSFNQLPSEYSTVIPYTTVPLDNGYNSSTKRSADVSYLPSENNSVYTDNYINSTTNYSIPSQPLTGNNQAYDIKQNYPISSTSYTPSMNYPQTEAYSYNNAFIQPPTSSNKLENYNEGQNFRYQHTNFSQEQSISSVPNYSHLSHSNYVEGQTFHPVTAGIESMSSGIANMCTGVDSYNQPTEHSYPSSINSVYAQTNYNHSHMLEVPYSASFVQTTTGNFNYISEVISSTTQTDASVLQCDFPMKTYTGVNNMYLQPGVVLHNYTTGPNTLMHSTPHYKPSCVSWTTVETDQSNNLNSSVTNCSNTTFSSDSTADQTSKIENSCANTPNDSSAEQYRHYSCVVVPVDSAVSVPTSNFPVQYTESTNTNQPETKSVCTMSVREEVSSMEKKKTSNVDLLSGLDFTINQAPLVPQPNKISKELLTIKPIEQPIIKTTQKVQEKEIKSILKVSTQKKQILRNTFQDPEVVKQFTQEVDKLEKFVDILSSKTLSGPTSLELKWKEIQDRQEFEQSKKSISVARCYPMKNRFPDILPFDQTRVTLPSKKDDYINASYVKNITTHSPEFIVTQLPLQSTFIDFWSMVCHENVKLILCLLNAVEIGNDIYWPKINERLSIGNFAISVEEQDVKPHWIDSHILINRRDERTYHKVRHIHFKEWPSSLFPKVSVISSFLNEVLSEPTLYSSPVLLHCSAGIGPSGLVCLLLSAITEVLINPSSLPDLPSIAIKLSTARKNLIRDREHFKFAYQVFLHYLKDLSVKNVVKKTTIIEGTMISEIAAPPDDPLSWLDPLWASKKCT